MMRFSYLLLLVLCFYPALSVDAWSWRPTAKPTPTPTSFCDAPPDISTYIRIDGNLTVPSGTTLVNNYYVTGNLTLAETSGNRITRIDGNVYVLGDLKLNKKSEITGSAYVHGSVDKENNGNTVIIGDICENMPIDLPVDELIGQCNEIFSDAAQSFTENSRLTMWNDSNIVDDSTSFKFTTLQGGDSNCQGSKCSVNGGKSTPLSPFYIPTIQGQHIEAVQWKTPSHLTLGASVDGITNGIYKGIIFGDLKVNANNVENGASITFLKQNDAIDRPYMINTLTLEDSKASVTFNSGVYAINNFNAQGGGTINIAGDGEVYLFIQNPSNMQFKVNSLPDKLHIILNKTVQFNSNAQIPASIYVNGDLQLDNSVKITGRVSAKNLTMTGNAEIINTEVCDSPPPTDLYAFTFAGTQSTAISCEPHPVKIQVLLGNSIDTSYAKQVTLKTRTDFGDWRIADANGSLDNGIPGDGVASYLFSTADNGEITLFLDHKQTGDVTISVANSDATASFDINFGSAIIKSEFHCHKPPIADNCIPTANRPFYLTLTALKVNPADSKCINYNPSAISFWSEYRNPTAPVGLSVEVAENAISKDPLTPTAITIPFSGGVATVSTNYPDAGEIAVHVSDVDDAAMQSAAVTIVNPYQLMIDTVTEQPRNVDSTRDVSDEGFIRASVPNYADLTVDTFNVTVNALKYCDDETTNKNCKGEANYQNKTPSFANDITLDPSCFPDFSFCSARDAVL
ncbi:DUF6701 domain-containing protein [Psychromonas sp. MME2]|uniref:DUF6701 domain-containing protein n=1 Tax=Psychromonas sp. MME2 TaxID=3231033 RepID=UPI00339C1644